MAAKNFSSIVSSIIDNILTVNPAIDVKIGEVVRDIFIDVQATAIEALYAIADNTSQAQSVTTAVNSQLDRLAYNYGITRNPATRSTVNVTISIKSGVQAPTPLNIGDQLYTVADINNNAIPFINTQYQLLQPGQTETTIPTTSLNTGSNTNVAAYTITQSNYDFADSVYNTEPATGGTDTESDAMFALRIPFNVTGQFINTSRGIINSIINIADINGSPYFVTPDSPLSRGQYTVDVYLQRSANYYGTVATEIAPSNQQNYIFLNQPLYSLEPINQITTYDPANGLISIVDPSQYTIINNPSDVQQNYLGSIYAKQMLNWISEPPIYPYTISYNYDHTIIDSQSAYDIHNEITADTLFKQANAIPVYISANLSVLSGSNFTSLNTNASNNMVNLFNGLSITQGLSNKEVEFSFLTDRNVLDVQLNNFDTTFQVILTIPTSSTFLTPSSQNSINPLGYYWEVDNVSPILSYQIAGRLWIGSIDVINSTNQITNGFGTVFNPSPGIQNQDDVASYLPNWSTNILPFYDSNNEILLLNFTSLPASGGGLLTLNFVQEYINVSSGLNYLTLAPPLVSPVEQYAQNVQTTNPQYATYLPVGLTDINQAILYQNGIQLTQTTTNVVGDYIIISGPDPTTGIINIQFTTVPASTDILQFGLLNPNITINYSTSNFSR